MKTALLILFSALLGAGIFAAGFDFGNYYAREVGDRRYDVFFAQQMELLNECAEGWESCLDRCEPWERGV